MDIRTEGLENFSSVFVGFFKALHFFGRCRWDEYLYFMCLCE